MILKETATAGLAVISHENQIKRASILIETHILTLTKEPLRETWQRNQP